MEADLVKEDVPVDPCSALLELQRLNLCQAQSMANTAAPGG